MSTTILLCDNDDRFRAALGPALERKGVRVVYAASERQALDLCAREAPDAIVLDLHMPRTRGFCLLWELHQRDSNRRILLLTGSLDTAVRTAALRLGAHACCAKSADADEIFALLFPPETEAALPPEAASG